MMRDLNVAHIEMDELWSYVGKKQKRLKPDDDPSKGDCWVFLAMDAINKGIISYRTGKRDWSNTGEFLADLRMRVLGKVSRPNWCAVELRLFDVGPQGYSRSWRNKQG